MSEHRTGACKPWVARAVCLLTLVACDDDRHSPQLGPPPPASALRGFPLDQPIKITLETDHGNIACELDAGRAPQAVALFVGLATGRARWQHPKTGEMHSEPLYRDLTFHRAIPGVMIQSGCVIGDSSGHPGYRIPVEAHPDDAGRLRQPGALALARYTPPPFRDDPNPPPPGHVLGSQFAVTLTDMSHLAGKVTVLGRCQNLDRVAAIARTFKQGQARPRLYRVAVTTEN